MLRLTVAVISLAIVIPISAQAAKDSGTGSDLLSYCGLYRNMLDGNDPRDMEAMSEIMRCVGFLQGIGAVLGEMEASVNTTTADLGICMPDAASTGQITRVVVKYLEENPALLHLSQDTLAIAALVHAFPCDKELDSLPANVLQTCS